MSALLLARTSPGERQATIAKSTSVASRRCNFDGVIERDDLLIKPSARTWEMGGRELADNTAGQTPVASP